MIISASRRTDIPSFYSKWFMNRLRAGYFLTRNPMNYAQVSKIVVSPESVDGIVFWTKDPKNMMAYLSDLDLLGYQYYFQFTLTPYGKGIECNLREKNEIIHTFQMLSAKVGRERIMWRYDPIILNNELTVSYHIDNFERICRQLCGYTGVCTISFVDIYFKISKGVKESLLREITSLEKHEIAAGFSEIGRKYRIELRTCAENIELTGYGIQAGACIDREIVERICGYSIDVGIDRNQRAQCGCIRSVDIGTYNTCRNGCLYCYANHNLLLAEKNYRSHNSDSEILIGTVSKDEKVRLTEKY